MNDSGKLTPAPEGFVLDEFELASEVASILQQQAPDLFEKLDAGELRYFAELDEERMPFLVLSDDNGVERGRMWLDWHQIGAIGPMP